MRKQATIFALSLFLVLGFVKIAKADTIKPEYQSAVIATDGISTYLELDNSVDDYFSNRNGAWSGDSQYDSPIVGTAAAHFYGGSPSDDTVNFIQLPESPLPSGHNPILSIEFFVNFNSFTNTLNCAWGISGNNSPGDNTHLSFCGANDGSIIIGHWGESDWDTGFSLSTGINYHIVYVSDGSSEKVFVNGELAAQRDANFDLNPSEFRLGGWNDKDGSYYPIDGIVDEFALYETAISAETVLSHYEIYNPDFVPPTTPTIGINVDEISTPIFSLLILFVALLFSQVWPFIFIAVIVFGFSFSLNKFLHKIINKNE